MQALKDWARRKDDSETQEGFLTITAPLRQLTIASFSLMLNRLNRTMQQLGMDTLVYSISRFRAQNITGHKIIPLVARRGDPQPITGFEKMKMLTYGSPKIRYLLHQLHTYSLPRDLTDRPRKLLVTEDIPMNTYFFEMVCKLMYVEAEVLHANLGDVERVNLVNRFNNPQDSLTVLIIMYQVSSQGVNLDSCCCQVVMATPALNAPLEIQAWSRVIQVCHDEIFPTLYNVLTLCHPYRSCRKMLYPLQGY